MSSVEDARDDEDGADLFADAEDTYTPHSSLEGKESSARSIEHDGGSQTPDILRVHPPPVRADPGRDTPSTASTLERAPSRSAYAKEAPTVWAVVVVSFDHAVGPIVEWAYPDNLGEGAITEIGTTLPFVALPDGAHLSEEDYAFFHLFIPSLAPDATVFGISCYRQQLASELLVKTPDVTRSTVQKAVVVLLNQPLYGCVRDKLGVVVRAFFAQRDFEDREILVAFYDSLQAGLGSYARSGELAGNSADAASRVAPIEGDSADAAMFMSTSVREFVHLFRLKTLQIVKLLLLQRKILFYGRPVVKLCTLQYSLVSLIPALLDHLEDAGSPILNARASRRQRPTSLQTSDRRSLIRWLGQPLDLFAEDAFFSPSISLQNIELLKTTRTYLAGTTNSLILQQKDCPIDAVVDIETGALEIRDPRLASAAALTAADRKFMDSLIATVERSWRPDDPSRPLGDTFEGSDDALRADFEAYVFSLLSAMKLSGFQGRHGKSQVLGSSHDGLDPLAPFGGPFTASLRGTWAYQAWDASTDAVIFDLVDPSHPGGSVTTLGDVGLRLSHTLKDLGADERFKSGSAKLSKSFATGSESVWRFAAGLRQDYSRQEKKTPPAADPAPPSFASIRSLFQRD